MLYYPLSAAFNAVVSLLLGAHILFSNRHNPVARAFLYHLLAVAAWSVPYFLWQISTEREQALLYCRLLMFGAILIAPLYCRFVLLWIGREKRHRGFIRLGFVLAGFFLLGNLTPWMVRDVEPAMFFDYWPKAGPLYGLYLVFFHFYAAASLYFVLLELRHSSGHQRNVLKYILVANLIGFVGGSTNYFLWYNVHVPPVGNPLVSAYHLIIAYAIVRYRLVDMDIILHRGLTFVLSIATVAAAVFGAFLGLVRAFPFLAETIRHPLWGYGLALLSVTVIALLFPLVRRRTDRLLLGTIFRDKHSYQDAVLDMIRNTPLLGGDETSVVQELADRTASVFGVSNVTIYLRSDVQNRWNLAVAGGSDVQGLPPGLPPGRGVTAQLTREHRVLLVEELDAIDDPTFRSQVRADFQALRAALVVPIEHESRPLGLLSLGAKASRDIFTNRDVELLATLAQQIALVLWGRRLQETVYQEGKLSALGTLAAGLAHEMNNPLVSVRTFLELIREVDIPDTYRDFSEQVLQDLERIRKLTEGITAFSGLAPGEERSLVHLDVLLDEVLTFLHHEVKIRKTEVSRRFQPGLPPVWANLEQLRQVFSNLILNAVEIMESGGSLTLVASEAAGAEVGRDAGAHVRVDITDSGPGMDAETVEEIFNPFFSTKPMHKGMGLTIVYQAVRANNGDIRVESQLGRGTTFSVIFPEGKADARGANAAPRGSRPLAAMKGNS